MTQPYQADIERFNDWLQRIEYRLKNYHDPVPLVALISESSEPVPFAEKEKGDFREIREGETWGKPFSCAWFKFEITLPESFKGHCAALLLNLGGEALLYRDGKSWTGLTNASCFSHFFRKDRAILFDSAKGGERLELWADAGANHITGIDYGPFPGDEPNPMGNYAAKISEMKLIKFHKRLWQQKASITTLIQLAQALPEKSVRKAQLFHILNRACDVWQFDDGAMEKCDAVLQEAYESPAAPADLKTTAVGHAHIDTAWLWPLRESIRKTCRTFANQIENIKNYPGYVFGASQPQLYQFVKDTDPDLYERIKQAVKDGRWELQGGMWVEADSNLISGESMTRQILKGKNFYLQEFGVEVTHLWLPDVFGYSVAIPQVLRKSGITSFITQKLSWSETNDFPHQTFIWEGIDGSEVLVHFPPINNYCASLKEGELVHAKENFKEKAFLKEYLTLFGIGNGGGGPKEEHLEFAINQQDIEGASKLEFGKAQDLIDRLEEKKDMLERWSGELYLERHRGTYTTMAALKTHNRRMEGRLAAFEALSVFGIKDFPADELDRIWKRVLTLQFHDILPGSSINRVNREAIEDYEKMNGELDSLLSYQTGQLCEEDEKALSIFNPSHLQLETPVTLPDSWKGSRVLDLNGNEIATQDEAGTSVVMLSLEPFGFTVIRQGDSFDTEPNSPSDYADRVLENGLIRYVFDESGNLIEAFDKIANRQILANAGNVFSLYDDTPRAFPAWDIDITYEKMQRDSAKLIRCVRIASGPVRNRVDFEYAIGASKIFQRVTLAKDSKRLDFETRTEWNEERQKMLRVHFEIDLLSREASYDSAYSFVRRPTHRNTSWDRAKFEVPAHRYADLSERDYGVALLNDCKYGYKTHDKTISLNLLRSSTFPDPLADRGVHHFTYSLLPHEGKLENSMTVFREAQSLNLKPLCLPGMAKFASPFKLEGEGIELDACKPSEDGKSTLLRFHECRGGSASARIELLRKGDITECDLMERPLQGKKPVAGSLETKLTPFEIRSFRINLKEK